MPLSKKQQKAVSAAPAAQRARMAANFANQNRTGSVRSTGRQPVPTRGRNRGRGRVSGRGIGSYRGSFKTTRVPVARGAVMEKRQSTTIRVKRSVYAESFNFVPDTPFSCQVFDVTPTNLAWLSQLSALFGRYKFNYYGYRYVTSSPTTIGGNVWAAFQPRSTQDLPTTLADVQNLAQHKISNVYTTWEQFTFIDKKLLNERWFLTEAIPQDSSGTISGFADRSPGRLLFGMLGAGNPGAPILGDLHITCEVVFESPTAVQFAKPVSIPGEGGFNVKIQHTNGQTIRIQAHSVITKPSFPLPGMDFSILRLDDTEFTGTASEVAVSNFAIEEEVEEDPMEKRIRELEETIHKLGLNISPLEMEQIEEDQFEFPDPEIPDQELISLIDEEDEEITDDDFYF